MFIVSQALDRIEITLWIATFIAAAAFVWALSVQMKDYRNDSGRRLALIVAPAFALSVCIGLLSGF